MDGIGKLLVWAVIIAVAGFGLFHGMNYLMNSGGSLKDSDSRVQKHLDEAMSLQREGKYDQAEARLRAALEIAPEHREVALTLGKLMIKQNRNKEAVQLLYTLFQRDPSSEMADQMYWVARQLYDDKDGDFKTRFTKAAELLEKYLEYRQGDQRGWLFKGVVYAKLKENSKALKSFNRIIETAPDSSEAQNAKNFIKEYRLK